MILSQIKNRKIIQWAVAYTAAAWAVLQVLEFVATTYNWPDTILRVTPIVLIGGLLLTILLAWFHGHEGKQRFVPAELVLLTLIILATTSAAIVVGHQPDSSPAPDAKHSSQQSVAVLPFTNISTDNESEYFANGIHDDLLTELAQLGGLDVISRTSVRSYKNTTKSMRQIARELGVTAVLEGSVQKAGNRVRVEAQLINALTDKHLWAERYDRDLTDVFAIQSDIAQQIAAALKARLTQGEQQTLKKTPTSNPEAYDAYLRGHEYETLPGQKPGNLESAIAQYERAIQLDPRFALAHARLGNVQGLYRWFGFDASDARYTIAQREAEAALRYDPSLPEAHHTLGNAYYWQRDYPHALAEYKTALRLAPNNVEMINALGFLHRRLGKFDEALEYFTRSAKLDPRNVDLYWDPLAQTFELARRHEEARTSYRRALALAPDLYEVKSLLGWNYLLVDGQLDTLRKYLKNADLSSARANQNPLYDRFWLELLERDFNAALRSARLAPDLIQNQQHYTPRTLMMGWAQQKLNPAVARVAFDSACAMLEKDARANPRDERISVSLALAYAGVGRSADAVREADRARALLPIERDALQGPVVARAAAAAYAQVGAKDKAIALLKQLLESTSRVTVPDLRLNPLYDPLRSDARFQALIK